MTIGQRRLVTPTDFAIFSREPRDMSVEQADGKEKPIDCIHEPYNERRATRPDFD